MATGKPAVKEADLYAETGEAALIAALERIWRNVTTRQMYITGAVAAGG